MTNVRAVVTPEEAARSQALADARRSEAARQRLQAETQSVCFPSQSSDSQRS